MSGAVGLHDLIVVFFGTGGNPNQTLTSLADTSGNTYATPTMYTDLSADLYAMWFSYAYNVASASAGALTITATFGNGASSFNFMIALEYTGVIFASNPSDGTAKAKSSGTSGSVSLVTANAVDVIPSFAVWDAGGETAGVESTLRANCPNAEVLGHGHRLAVLLARRQGLLKCHLGAADDGSEVGFLLVAHGGTRGKHREGNGQHR